MKRACWTLAAAAFLGTFCCCASQKSHPDAKRHSWAVPRASVFDATSTAATLVPVRTYIKVRGLGAVHGSDTYDLRFSSCAVPKTSELATENLALRQQLAVLREKVKRPCLRRRDRIFWVWRSRLWAGWRCVLVIVQPDTVVRWHRDGFRLYWRWKSRAGKVGRPRIEAELRRLIRRMCRENPSWGAPRIHSELRLLGYDVSETTVDKYMVRHRKLPSQTWRTFLKNHMPDTVGVDFFTMPTATFRVLYAFIVVCHHRRCVMHFNVTQYPTAEWTARQIIEAFPEDYVPRFLVRDRDSIYGHYSKNRIKNMGIEEVVTARRSPWQNPYVERIHGSIRRECLNQVVVLNERHLRRILSSYLAYYHEDRTHLSLDRNSPAPREIELPGQGRVVSIPRVGGLHHRYRRAV